MAQELHIYSDHNIRKTILAKFAADEHTAFADLRVGVLNGIVHLAGVVTALEIRIAAAELAEDVPGVRGIVNRIEAPGAPSPARTVHLNLKNDKGNTDE